LRGESQVDYRDRIRHVHRNGDRSKWVHHFGNSRRYSERIATSIEHKRRRSVDLHDDVKNPNRDFVHRRDDDLLDWTGNRFTRLRAKSKDHSCDSIGDIHRNGHRA